MVLTEGIGQRLRRQSAHFHRFATQVQQRRCQSADQSADQSGHGDGNPRLRHRPPPLSNYAVAFKSSEKVAGH
jgi:hypothetical protein